MSVSRIGGSKLFHLVAVLFVAFAIAGCDGDDGAAGADGTDGADGAAGPPGADGINCWDLNENGVEDPEEDLNGDGVVDVNDCSGVGTGAYEAEKLHAGYFTDNAYEGTQSCLDCHGLIGEDLLTTGHFKWQGQADGLTGFEGLELGKNQIINNFCIAVPSNEGRCTNCHAGYGYADDTFAFNDRNTVDCLVCHDQTGDYAKNLTTAGLPVDGIDLSAVARSVAENGGKPTISNCIDCHAKAGGGDNVKHGDLAMALETGLTRDDDVHMGTGSVANYECTDCHKVNRVGGPDSDTPMVNHGIGGMVYHSTDEGYMKDCGECHGTVEGIHAGSSVEGLLNLAGGAHQVLACQVCHIPTFARVQSTKTEWYWEDAGKDLPLNPEPVTNRDTFAKKKGSFVWEKNVRPSLLYYDGKWDKALIGLNDNYDDLEGVLAKPSATYETEGAMIYPFKRMIGNQPVDNNGTILVPHLFGLKGGDNPFWAKYDWDLALADGAAYAGQTFSGPGGWSFRDTVMYLAVNHEVAPKEMALGLDDDCGDCHFEGKYDWTLLGYTGDPLLDGERGGPR